MVLLKIIFTPCLIEHNMVLVNLFIPLDLCLFVFLYFFLFIPLTLQVIFLIDLVAIKHSSEILQMKNVVRCEILQNMVCRLIFFYKLKYLSKILFLRGEKHKTFNKYDQKLIALHDRTIIRAFLCVDVKIMKILIFKYYFYVA